LPRDAVAQQRTHERRGTAREVAADGEEQEKAPRSALGQRLQQRHAVTGERGERARDAVVLDRVEALGVAGVEVRERRRDRSAGEADALARLVEERQVVR